MYHKVLISYIVQMALVLYVVALYVIESYCTLITELDMCAVQCHLICCRYLLQLQKLCTEPLSDTKSLVSVLVSADNL